MNLKRLLLVYLSALTLLFVSVFVSMVLTELEAGKVAEDAKKINLAGRQRMLSQRIIYLSQSLSILKDSQRESVRAELLSAVNELQTAVRIFEVTHRDLSQATQPDTAAADLYFLAGPSSASLDHRVADYIRLARMMLDDPTNDAALAGLVAIERAGLLGDLNAVVTDLEIDSISRIALLRNVERGSLALALLIILIEVIFVFVPGHRFIRRTHDDLRAKNQELKRAYEISEALRKEQSEFTYAVSHDLKSPASTIELVLSELLIEEGDQLSLDGRELLDHAMATVQRIGVQVEDILNYACATSEAPEIEAVDINACIAEALSNLQAEIEDKQATIDVSADAILPGFQGQITMLLQNLIGNALKYQVAGHEVQVNVSVEARPDEEGVQIVVADNGIGIDPANHDKIFKLFERLHLRDDYPGTGLGLPTCKRVADNHQGNITLDSELGKGTRFTVHLRTPMGTTDYSVREQAA